MRWKNLKLRLMVENKHAWVRVTVLHGFACHLSFCIFFCCNPLSTLSCQSTPLTLLHPPTSIFIYCHFVLSFPTSIVLFFCLEESWAGTYLWVSENNWLLCFSDLLIYVANRPWVGPLGGPPGSAHHWPGTEHVHQRLSILCIYICTAYFSGN